MDRSATPEPHRPAVLLVGHGPTTRTALESLLGSCRITGVVRNVRDDVATLALSHGIPVLSARTPSEIAAAKAFALADCVVVSSYDRIFPATMLSQKPHVNVHYACLPSYRGRASVNWAIINGAHETGITVHRMIPGLDAGAVLFHERVPIGAGDTVTGLYDRLNAIQKRELGPAILRHLAGDPGQAQDEADATYGCARLPDDGEIDWAGPTIQADRLVRALTAPFPGAFSYFRARRLVIHRARIPDVQRVYAGRIPGRVVGVSTAEGWVDVLTGDGILRLLEVSLEDGPRLAAAQVIGSTRDTLGLSRSDLLAKIGELTARLDELSGAVARHGVRSESGPHAA